MHPDEQNTPVDQGISGELRHDGWLGSRDLTLWPSTAGRTAAAQATRASVRLGPQRTLVLILGIGTVVAVLLAFAASRVYDAVTEADGVASLDTPILAAAMSARSPFLNGFAATIAVVFGPIGMPIIALLSCGALAARRRSMTPIVLTVAAGVGSLLMTVVGKDIIGRSRPKLSDAIPPFEFSPSFPSGHTLNATVILGVLAYLLILRRRTTATRVTLCAIALVIAVIVGLTRVLLGAHWFTDVLAGWLLGAAWLTLIITAHRLYLTAMHRIHQRVEDAAPTREVFK